MRTLRFIIFFSILALWTQPQVASSDETHRLRGITVLPTLKQSDVAELHQWGVNLVNVQLHHPQVASLNRHQYHQWIAEQVQQVDAILTVLRSYQIAAVLSLLSPPGGTLEGEETTQNVFVKRQDRKQLVQAWEDLAQHFKDHPQIKGYLILSEPGEPFARNRGTSWNHLSRHITRQIRKIDRRTPIIVQSAFGDPFQLRKLKPLKARKIWYSFNFYFPYSFTHQGIVNDLELSFPSKRLTRRDITRALRSGLRFQRRHHVRMFIAEYSAVRWAPNQSALRYIRQVSKFFERAKWDWTYHAFRGSPNVWSVEHSTAQDDDEPLAEDGARELFLKELYAKNW